MFKFFQKRYKGSEVSLVERRFITAEEDYDHIPTALYDIVDNHNAIIGHLELRLVINDYSYYYGNVGYDIIEEKRGHNYAYKACMVLFKEVIKEYNLNEIYITCNPDNYASKRVIEKLGCEYIETAKVPPKHELYLQGERVKEIYKYYAKD